MMPKTQLVGLFLWRGGLALAAIASMYYAAWLLLTTYFAVIPGPIKTGIALIVAGLALLTISFVLERIDDRRTEGDLQR